MALKCKLPFLIVYQHRFSATNRAISLCESRNFSDDTGVSSPYGTTLAAKGSCLYAVTFTPKATRSWRNRGLSSMPARACRASDSLTCGRLRSARGRSASSGLPTAQYPVRCGHRRGRGCRRPIARRSSTRRWTIRTTEELAAQSLFALEAHLEEFIAYNWAKISWGAALELYREGEQTGRQYPAATWSIDFLAVDQNTNELVVIELKRSQTSDATVGQVLRYINWIKKNLAKPDQKVRGIIVASEIDDALRYAVTGLPNVSVKTYTVTFSLQAAEI
jgi:hypothetical protein